MAGHQIDTSSPELETLLRISQAIAHHADVGALVYEVLDILCNEMPMERGSLTLRRMGSDEVFIAASRGLSREEQERGRYSLGEGITGRVAESGEPALIPDISKEPSFLGKTGSQRAADVAFMCVPIIRQKEVVGTMGVDHPRRDNAELEQILAFLQIIANILGEAVWNIQQHVEERESLVAENRKLRMELGEYFRPSNIIGNCASMRAIYNLIGQVADSPATVLIRGESGTGKELVARALHYGSQRKNQPFVSVNIAAVPENLIESELFGHEKGAFTGALKDRKGRFEMADGGTLFLDEIGDAPLSVQVRLLRVIQEREFERVGGTEPIRVNVRIVTATSQDLETLMQEERFREDLYFRLNVFPIMLPALRERRSDIILLADHFLNVYNGKYQKTIKRISTPAINMMMSYHWPGNVRELENCIEWASITATDEVVHGFNLPPSLQTAKETHTELIPEGGASLEVLTASYEREIIVDSLKASRGNCAAAARALQTTQRKLNYRIKQLGINPKNFK
jgi:Nif-specific regulatory protein